MDWPILILGVIIGLMVAASKVRSIEQKRSTPQASRTFPESILRGIAQQYEHNYSNSQRGYRDTRVGHSYNTFTGNLGNDPADYLRRTLWRRPTINRDTPQVHIDPQTSSQDLDTKALLKIWRKSVVGLIKLAEKNLASAKQHFDLGHFTIAVDTATTSVENIARALMHCYGEKPDINSGQEEILRMMLCRFHGEEKIELERAVNNIAKIRRDRIVLKQLTVESIEAQQSKEVNAKQALESASAIVDLFKRIIDDYFAAEIPELEEKCPKCHSLDISIWGFSQEVTTCQCNICQHKWMQSNFT